MRQVISLFLPTWPTDRLRRRLGSSAPHPDTPLVLAAMEGQRGLLTAANAAARAIGLVHGMTVAQAQALRSEERREGKECVSTGRSRWQPSPKKQNRPYRHLFMN